MSIKLLSLTVYSFKTQIALVMNKDINSLNIEQLKAELLDKHNIIHNILESSMAGYWDWYIQEDYEYLSPTFKLMFGYEDHEIPNTPDSWHKIIHPEDLPGVFEIYEKHVQSKGKIPYDNEVRYFHKDGSIIWVFCRGKIIEWDEEGKPVRMVGCHIDITALKTIEEKQQQTLQLLAQKNQELLQIAYVVSHDLQEPLRTLSNYTGLLEEEFAGKFG